MIPCFEQGGERWTHFYPIDDSLDIARGYINFFEPDCLVEGTPGMAEKLGWESKRHFGLPRVITLDQFYEVTPYGVQFAAGIDVSEPMSELYNTEHKYERRHKQPFGDIKPSPGNAFFDVVGGRYPADDALSYIPTGFRTAFASEELEASAETATKLLTQAYAGPLWVTRHGLNESADRGVFDRTFCVFDPTDAGDVIDFWNLRLVERSVFPISIEWFEQHKALLREQIREIHRPIPANPYGTMFRSAVQFGRSISDEKCQLLAAELADLPNGSWVITRPPMLWPRATSSYVRRNTKILAAGKPASFDEEIGSGGYVKIPAPAPSFLNATGYHSKARWANIVELGQLEQRADPAIVYPSNLWSPDYPRLGSSRELRIGREGWVLALEHDIGYSLLKPQEGREAIIGWLAAHGITATPSEEGQVTARVIAAAETLLACSMFADPSTVQLLNGMAEGHTEVHRQGRAVVRSTPDRSKPIQYVDQHFKQRKKGSFGFWNAIEFFLERSVFRAGLSVQCPVCSYHNWFAADALSYKPTCSRCLNSFDLSQKPDQLSRLKWYYRVIGPFAAPDYARGAYAVALTLRILAPHHDTKITWSTGLQLDPLNCEIDFVAWHESSGLASGERHEPLLVLGEAKSFGVGSINDDAIDSLKKVAERFPGAVMVVSSMRNIDHYSLAEIGRLRLLALWGRRKLLKDQPINPLIVLTETELFARYDIGDAWKQADGEETHPGLLFNDLHTLAELTQRRYLKLPGYWDPHPQNSMHESIRRILSALQSRAAGP